MESLKIGFVPAHREPFDENWAIQMRKRCLQAFPSSPLVEIITPDEKLTQGGCVRNDAEAGKVIDLFKKKRIDGLIIGTVTFGDEVSALSIASAFHDHPILLFGTKEGSFTADGNRRSDSFCGTLSISSGLHAGRFPSCSAALFSRKRKSSRLPLWIFYVFAPSPEDLSAPG
jgi:L-fucose isomerase-like protein